MIDIAFYLVTREVAERCGLLNERYITDDGKFILDNKDLSRLRLTSTEFVNGVQGIEMITKEEADDKIKQGGYQLGETINEQQNNEEE